MSEEGFKGSIFYSKQTESPPPSHDKDKPATNETSDANIPKTEPDNKDNLDLNKSPVAEESTNPASSSTGHPLNGCNGTDENTDVTMSEALDHAENECNQDLRFLQT